jgi:hypothetical protein
MHRPGQPQQVTRSPTLCRSHPTESPPQRNSTPADVHHQPRCDGLTLHHPRALLCHSRSLLVPRTFLCVISTLKFRIVQMPVESVSAPATNARRGRSPRPGQQAGSQTSIPRGPAEQNSVISVPTPISVRRSRTCSTHHAAANHSGSRHQKAYNVKYYGAGRRIHGHSLCMDSFTTPRQQGLPLGPQSRLRSPDPAHPPQ